MNPFKALSPTGQLGDTPFEEDSFFHGLSKNPDFLGADAGKIGVVDMKKFQKKSKVFLETSMVLKKEFESMQKKLDDERMAYQKIEDDFKKKSMMLSLDAQGDQKRELERKKRHIKYLAEDFAQEMKYMEMEARMKIVREISKVVSKIGKNEGYTLILEKSSLGIIYSSATIDLTDRVVEAYDGMKR